MTPQAFEIPQGNRCREGNRPPHAGYRSCGDALGPLNEFRDMVKALHRAGIEVILDVVFHHTAEEDHTGPTFCFKGFGPATYPLRDAKFANDSGTGNSMSANHSVVHRLISDRVQECQTGFASTLPRFC